MQMTSMIPLSAILLFMVLLNLVHSLDNSIERQTNAILFELEDDPDLDYDDDNQMNEDNDDETTSMTTHLNNVPTVTTIIIIQTVAGQAFRDIGSSSTANNGGNGTTDPNDDNLQMEEKKDDSALKRMISIPTVIGGVVIAAIIGGAIVFMRLRAKRRHAKALQQCQELSTTHLQGNEGGNGTHHDGGHQRQYSNASTTAYVSPIRNRDYSTNTVPSAPLEATISPDNQLPERHTISSVQQYLPPTSSSAPVPSAPSTKELEISTSIDVRRASRIYTDSSSSYYLPHSSSPPSTAASIAPSSPLKSPNGLESSDESSQLPSTPDIPPPAYTASAPPLFLLPSNQRRRSADQLSLDRYRR